MSRIARKSAVLGLAAALAALGGCAGSSRGADHLVEASYPEYSPAEAALFDDGMAPEIFGISVGGTPETDPKLAERVQRADSVITAKIATATTDTRQGGLELTVRSIGPQLAGRPEPEPVDLRVKPDNPAFGMIDSVGTKLAGRTMIFFLRRYNEDGSVVVHWHAEPESDEVKKAVGQAAALEDLE